MWWEVYVHFINPPLPIFYRFKLLSYICPSVTSTPKKLDKRFPSVSQTRSGFFHLPLASLLSCHPPPPFTRPPSVAHVHRKVPPGWTYSFTYIVYTALSSQCALTLFEFRHSFKYGCGFLILFKNLDMKMTDIIIFVTVSLWIFQTLLALEQS